MKNAIILILLLGCSTDPATSSALFEDADVMECDELALAWFENLGVELDGRQGCMSDDDCVVGENAVECPGGVSIGGCGVGVAAEHLADVDMARLAAAEVLCAARSEPCVATSLCPAEVQASCIDGLCRVR